MSHISYCSSFPFSFLNLYRSVWFWLYTLRISKLMILHSPRSLLTVFCLSVCVSICLSVCLSLSLSYISRAISVLSLGLLSISLSVCLSAQIFIKNNFLQNDQNLRIV